MEIWKEKKSIDVFWLKMSEIRSQFFQKKWLKKIRQIEVIIFVDLNPIYLQHFSQVIISKHLNLKLHVLNYSSGESLGWNSQIRWSDFGFRFNRVGHNHWSENKRGRITLIGPSPYYIHLLWYAQTIQTHLFFTGFVAS